NSAVKNDRSRFDELGQGQLSIPPAHCAPDVLGQMDASEEPRLVDVEDLDWTKTGVSGARARLGALGRCEEFADLDVERCGDSGDNLQREARAARAVLKALDPDRADTGELREPSLR